MWDSRPDCLPESDSFPDDDRIATSPMSISSSSSGAGSYETKLGASNTFAPSSLIMLHNSLMKSLEDDNDDIQEFEDMDDNYDGFTELSDTLHNCIVENKFKRLTNLLLERPSVDLDSQFRDVRSSNCTLMHKAAKYQRVQIMNFLFEKGASVDSEDDLMATPIFYAAAAGALQSCAFLLSKNAQLNIRDRNSSSPLSLALKNNCMEAARMMILANADINYKVGAGDPLLHIACEEGNLEKVVFLLKNGATLLRTNSSNENCLFMALPHPIVVQTLCRHASENNQLIKMIRATDLAGNTVIHRCAQHGHFESFERILQILSETKGSSEIFDVLSDQDKTKNNDTCLHMAAAGGHAALLRYILDVCRGIQLDLQKFENRNGDCPLHTAVKHKRGECVLILKNSDKKGKVQKHKNAERLTPKALAESLNLMDVWNFTAPQEQPVSPSMLNRLFKRKLVV